MTITRRGVLVGIAGTVAAATLPTSALGASPRRAALDAPADPVPAPTGRPIIFFTPHQDDETLFMGHAIAHHALTGREVHVVLITDGRASSARAAINGESGDPWWPGYHYPAREGYAPLDEATFSAARTAELRSAVGQLGVWPGNIHTAGLSESGFTVANAQAVIEEYHSLYPTAGLYTMSWDDANSVHSACGQALANVATATGYSDCRWMIKPENRANISWSGTYNVPSQYAAQADLMVQRAVMVYEAWNPVQGSYAIGGHSVGVTYFEPVLAGEPNYIHKLAAA